MERWQLDVVGGFLFADGSHAKALNGVDDHSRFCVSAALMALARARPVCDALARALAEFGVPQQILTDNGKVFTGCFGHPPGPGGCACVPAGTPRAIALAFAALWEGAP